MASTSTVPTHAGKKLGGGARDFLYTAPIAPLLACVTAQLVPTESCLRSQANIFFFFFLILLLLGITWVVWLC
jgi:hypothetical protein